MKNLALIVLVAASAAFGAPQTWDIDASHSTASFKVKHLLVTNVKGDVGGLEGKFTTDGDDMTKLTIDAKADMRTITTNNKDRDKHLNAEDFFHTKKFPTTTFKSKKVTKEGDKLKILGDLTLRGVTKEVTLDAEPLTAPVNDPWGSIRRGFSAHTKISRKDFGVSFSKTLETGGAIVGDEVDINWEVELKTEAPKTEKKKG